MKVRDVMTTDLFCVGRQATMFDAKQIMNWKRVRHVPVVDDERKLLGLVTHRDLLAASASSLGSSLELDNANYLKAVPVELNMHHELLTVEPDTGLWAAALTLRDYKFGCLPVVEDDRLVGILTESDFVFLVATNLPPATVDSLMSTDLWTLEADNTLDLVQEVMDWAHVRHVPIVRDQGTLVGMLSHRDLLRACLSTLVSVSPVVRSYFLSTTTVLEVATTNVITTRPWTSLKTAAETLLREGISALPVLDREDRLVGILAESDFVRAIAVQDLRGSTPSQEEELTFQAPVL
jgi:CBS domain-containing membrane protein